MSGGQSARTTAKNRRAAGILVGLLAPGAGHLVRGRPVRGAIWFGALLLCALLSPHVPFVALTPIAIWLAALIDVVRISDGPRSIESRALFFVVGAVVVAEILVFVAVRTYYVEARKVPSGGMLPTLAIDDHILVNKSSYWFSSPARGDVVVFRQPCKPDTLFVKRVIATAGDTVEVRCGRVFVNGEQVALELEDEQCTFWDYEEVMNTWHERSCARYREAGAYSVLHPGTLRDEADDHDFPRIPTDGSAARLPRCSQSPGPPKGAFEPVAGSGGACEQQLAYRVPDGHLFVMGDNRSNSSDSRVWGTVPEGNVVGRASMIWWPGGHGGFDAGRVGGIE